MHVSQLPVNSQAALWRSSVIELPVNGQVALQGSNVNQLPVNIPSLGNNPTGFRANGDVVYSESRSQPQAYGVHYEASGTLATVKAEMQTSGTTTDTVQEESFVAQPFIENAAAYAPPQQYNHQDTHASVIVPPTNTPSVNELMYEARPIDELLARSDVVPQRLQNVFCLTSAENTSDYGHENKATSSQWSNSTTEQQCELASSQWSSSTTEQQCKPASSQWSKSTTEQQCKPASSQWSKSTTEQQCKPASSQWSKSTTEQQCKPASSQWSNSTTEQQCKPASSQ